jgi:dihydrofolate reductase
MKDQNVSLIVAVSENNVIGSGGDLPWHISADLKRFRQLTTGHHIILGRKTFESIGRLLPERKTIIVTRNPDFSFPGAIIVNNVSSAVSAAADDEQPFVAGGAEIYRASIDFVTTIYLTRVHTEIDGDTLLPEIDWGQWHQTESARFDADKKNEFDYSFEVYRRKST